MSYIQMFRLLAWAAIGVLAGILIAFSGFLPFTGQSRVSENASTVEIGGSFQLTSHTGETVNNETLAGKPYLVFFGFTHCPDICPTTLSELSNHMQTLGSDADLFTPLFITVDPERDSREILAGYMTAFDHRIVALRGDLAETEAAVEAFSAYYAKVPLENGGYTMDHTSGVLLMNSQGNFMGTVDIHEPRETVLDKLRRLADA